MEGTGEVPGPRHEGYHPRADVKPSTETGKDQAHATNSQDTAKKDAQKLGAVRGLIKRASETLVPKDKPKKLDEITEQDFAKYIRGNGEATPASPGLSLSQMEADYLGHRNTPRHDTKEFSDYLDARSKLIKITSQLVMDGTLRLVEEEQPSGEKIPTYAIADPAKLEAHTKPPQPVMQAHRAR